MSLLFIRRFPCAKAVVAHLFTLILAIFVDKRIVSLWLLDLTEDVGHERRCKSHPDGSNMLFFFPAKSRSGPTILVFASHCMKRLLPFVHRACKG